MFSSQYSAKNFFKSKDFKEFWTNIIYTLYKNEMCVKFTDINKDKARVVSNSDNFGYTVALYLMF